MLAHGPFRIADGYVFDDDFRAQGSFQVNGAGNPELPTQGFAGSGLQLISINSRIHHYQNSYCGCKNEQKPDENKKSNFIPAHV